ncbi:hypothetical protein [Nitritalea halalkaliphila]|uniref:hypothetical protein n=1 Tax=Nitritalea halalkaliphila TaxID=590849 RepID=UPI0012EAD537|nr:hypothetical protein [Nitritalea halalkaliphila]
MDLNYKIMRRYTILLIISIVISFSASAQEKSKRHKNYLSTGATYVIANSSLMQVTGPGYSIAYSRYFGERFFGSIAYGRVNSSVAAPSIFHVGPEAQRDFDLSFFNLGLGYDIFQRPNFTLAAQVASLRTEQTLVQDATLFEDGSLEQTFRRNSDLTAQASLIARFKLIEHVHLHTQAAYAPRWQNFGSVWLHAGISFSL